MKRSLPFRTAATLLIGVLIAASVGAFHPGRAAADDDGPPTSPISPSIQNVQLTQTASGITAKLTYRNNDTVSELVDRSYSVLAQPSLWDLQWNVGFGSWDWQASAIPISTPAAGQTSTATLTTGLGNTQCFIIVGEQDYASGGGQLQVNSNIMCATFSNATEVSSASRGCVACANTGLRVATETATSPNCLTCQANIGIVPNRIESPCGTATCADLPFQGTANGGKDAAAK
jgi:hypothetical protein